MAQVKQEVYVASGAALGPKELEAIAFVSCDACFCLSRIFDEQGNPFLLSWQVSGEMMAHLCDLSSSCRYPQARGSLASDCCVISL